MSDGTTKLQMVPLAQMPSRIPGTTYYMWRALALNGSVPAVRSGGKGKILIELQGAIKYLESATLKDIKVPDAKRTGIRELGNDKYHQ